MTRRSPASPRAGLLLVLSATACAVPPPLARAPLGPGTQVLSFEDQDEVRTLRLHLPPGPPDEARPLLVVLHGGGSSGEGMEEVTGFSRIADREGFVVVYPDGLGGPHGLGRAWNDGRCCGYSTLFGIDDVRTIEVLVDALEARLPVDGTRRYVVGYSNGAALAYRVAARQSGRYAALGIYAGTMQATGSLEAPTFADPPPSPPLSVITVMSEADPRIDYYGDEGWWSTDPSQRQIGEFWAAAAGCGRNPVTVAGDDPSVLVRRFHHCPRGLAVEQHTLYGWNHEWPGPANLHGCRAPGQPLYDFDTAETMWTFFADKRRPPPAADLP